MSIEDKLVLALKIYVAVPNDCLFFMDKDFSDNSIIIDFKSKPSEKEYIVCYLDILGTTQQF